MSNGSGVRVLALAVLLGLALCPASAIAQKQKATAAEENGGENGAEHENGNGNGNGNGKESDEGWKFKAKLNRALLYWNDHGSSGFRHVDNDQDSSGVELEGKFNLGSRWSTTIKFGLDVKYVPSGTVSQLDSNGEGLIVEVGDALWELEHEALGKIVIGHGDSASDGTGNVNLAKSNVLADAEVNNWNDSFFVRVNGSGLSMVRWGDFFAGPNVGETGRFIRYVTPKVNGFEASAAVGRPQEIILHGPQHFFMEKNHGLFTDFAIRYDQMWSNYHIKAELGVFRDTTEEMGATEPTHDTGISGSIAVMHVPTGLNIAVNHGVVKHTRHCEEPGAVSGKCRGPDRFIYVKGGLVRNVMNPGPTAFYAEYYRGWRSLNDSDETALRAFEVNAFEAEELAKSVMTMWGLGVVQTINSRTVKNFATDLYIGYRHYELDVKLLGGKGAAAARDIRDIDMVMAGIRFRWGENGEE